MGAASPRSDPTPNPVQGLASLTEREREVLELWIGHLSDDEVAEKLTIPRVAAAEYAKSICLKLGAENRSQAVAIALGAREVRSAPGPLAAALARHGLADG
jgi:DNA-binding CsgD family transcriptional regulator